MELDLKDKEYLEELLKYDIEELEFMLENPEEIETGEEIPCDDCINYQLNLIKKAIKIKMNL